MNDTPYFLWDYKMTNKEVKAILASDNDVEKQWLMGRILAHAKFEDVWKYVTIDEVVAFFPKLRLPSKTHHAWEKALTVWGYHV